MWMWSIIDDNMMRSPQCGWTLLFAHPWSCCYQTKELFFWSTHFVCWHGSRVYSLRFLLIDVATSGLAYMGLNRSTKSLPRSNQLTIVDISSALSTPDVLFTTDVSGRPPMTLASGQTINNSWLRRSAERDEDYVKWQARAVPWHVKCVFVACLLVLENFSCSLATIAPWPMNWCDLFLARVRCN